MNKSKLKYLIFITFAGLCCFPLLASAAPASLKPVRNVTIEYISVDSDRKTIFFKTVEPITSDIGCTEGHFYESVRDDPWKNEILSALLAAQASGNKITVWVDEHNCSPYRRPLFHRVEVLSR